MSTLETRQHRYGSYLRTVAERYGHPLLDDQSEIEALLNGVLVQLHQAHARASDNRFHELLTGAVADTMVKYLRPFVLDRQYEERLLARLKREGWESFLIQFTADERRLEHNMTTAEVRALLGSPSKIARHGSYETWTYPTKRVIFRNHISWRLFRKPT